MANGEFIEVISEESKRQLDDFIAKLNITLKSVQKINANGIKAIVPSQAKKVIQETNNEIKKSNKLKSEAEKLDLSLQRAQEKLNTSRSKAFRELQKVRVEQQAQTRAAKEEAIQNSSLVGAYQKLNLQRSQASKRLRDLIASGTANNAQLRKAQNEFNRLDARIRKADMAVRDHTKNVGNYRSALGGLGGSLRSLMGAFGMIGGIYLFASALRDAFSRVREFDKAMQNLTGIFGVSRDELKDLEAEIINVAGSSINTSNQVANLATSMVALGKTKREVKQLLKPVNDLSIALGASAEMTGEFLIQTLNAFGKGADSGEEFANIIAKVRTSTALDFERIQLAMGYLAPVANALNMSLEETSAILGVLVDNGIKAQRAGRLMGSAFGRLATNGITLEQALSQINASSDKLVTSTELFGTEAGTLGLILANNTEKVKEYTASFEEASGSLDKLTNEQLKSMDAQLKILDSTWESLVLSIENGDGAISKAFTKIIGGVTKLLDKLIEVNKTAEEIWDSAGSKAAKGAKELFEEFGKEKATEILKGRVANLNKELDKVNGQLEKSGSLFYHSSETGFISVGKLERKAHDLFGQILELNAAIGTMGEKYEETDVKAEDLNDTVDETNEGLKDQQKLIAGTVAYYNNQIRKLKELRDSTATTSDEYQSFGEQIKMAEYNLEQLTQQIELLDKATDAFSWEELEKMIGAFEEIDEKELDEFIKKGLEKLERQARRTADALNALPDVFNIGFSSAAIDIFRGINMEIDKNAEKTEQFSQQMEKLGHVASGVGTLITGVFRTVTQAQNTALENQLRNLETQRNVELAFAGESAEARGAIEERFAERKRAIQAKQARNSKAMAIMEATVGTAVAVIKALPNILLASLIGALGAAQIAAIASAPIPQFKDGVRDFEGGQAIVGDGGKKEVMTDKKGRVLGVSGTKPELVNLPKGANVYRNEKEWQNSLGDILNYNGISLPKPVGSPQIEVNAGMTASEMEAIMRKTLGSQATMNVVVDKSGVHTHFIKQNAKLNQLNNRVTGKGRAV